MLKLSKRMRAVAAMVTTGNILADVGTDHGHHPFLQDARILAY